MEQEIKSVQTLIDEIYKLSGDYISIKDEILSINGSERLQLGLFKSKHATIYLYGYLDSLKNNYKH